MRIERSKEWWLSRIAKLEPEPGGYIGSGGDGHASCNRPTWRDHLGRWLGYRPQWPDVDADPKAAALPGWWATDTHIHLGFWDRVRLLLRGDLLVRSHSRSEARPETVITASATSIVSPFDRNT